MTPRPGRRSAALIAGLGLAAGSLLVAPAAPASAAAPNDSAPAVAGGDWLAAQLTGGVIYNDQFDFDDYGLTLDTGLALDDYSSNRYAGALRTLTAKVSSAEGVGAYTTGESFGDAGSRYAGETGKLASFLQQRGEDPRDASGTNLINQLRGRVATEAPIAGRAENRSEFGDNTNAIGQGFVARALTVAGNARGATAMDFFLDQQCSEGYFRTFLDSDKSDADQTCDGATGDEDQAPSADATGIAVLNLVATDPAPGSDVQDAIDAGVAWLLAEQNSDGSYTGPPPTDTPNANTTGVAAWALAAVGEEDAATRAAEWLSGLQTSACDGWSAADSGAVAYDQTAYDRGLDEGIVVETRDQFRRTSAQAVPVLRSLADPAGSPRLTGPAARFVRAGSTVSLGVTGLPEGRTVCVAGPDGGTEVTGPTDSVDVEVPAGSGTRRWFIEGEGKPVALRALDAKTLAASVARPRPAKGVQQTVTVKRLAAQERVTVKVAGTRVARGTANANGVYKATFKAAGPRGTKNVKVVGQFGNRTGSTSYVVR
jgi:hypothetical protein